MEQFRGAFFHQFAWNLILYQSNLISKRGQQFPGDQLLCEILRSWGVATSFSPLSRLSSLSLSVFLSLLHFLSACRCGEFYRASRLTVFFPFCSATKTNAQHTCTLSLCVCVCVRVSGNSSLKYWPWPLTSQGTYYCSESNAFVSF